MEDIKIKEFDRSIEKLMNESSVPPPYGMWNRIASELNTGPGTAPASIATQGRSFIILATGLAMVGASLLTAYLVNQPNSQIQKPISSLKVVTGVSSPKEEINISEAPVVTMKVEKPLASARVLKKKSVKTEIAPAAIALPNEPANELPILAYTDLPIAEKAVAIEEPISESVQNSTEPAIITTKSNSVTPSVIAPIKQNIVEGDNEEPKASAYAERKIKFKPPRKKKFQYGRIIHRRK